jgi:hypothetical protein
VTATSIYVEEGFLAKAIATADNLRATESAIAYSNFTSKSAIGSANRSNRFATWFFTETRQPLVASVALPVALLQAPNRTAL